MFEGKEVNVILRSGEKIPGIVVSCIKDVGISIVEKHYKDAYLYCLRMKLAPNFSGGRGYIGKTRKLFTAVRKGIIAGTVDFKELDKVRESVGTTVSGAPASSSQCAFGQ